MRSSETETAIKRSCRTLEASCAECSGKVRRAERGLVCASCRCYFHDVTSTRLQADNLHRLMNGRCRFSNSRPDLASTHPGAEPRLYKQYQGPTQDQLVILQWNANGILREMVPLDTVLVLLQVDVACIQKAKLLPKDKNLKFHKIGQFVATTQFWWRQGAKASSSTYVRHGHSLPPVQLLEHPMCWRD